MKRDIHPSYHDQAKVTCVTCGTSFSVGSSIAVIQTESCSQCHPFYTGESRILDTTGRVERFQERMKKADVKKKSTPSGTKKVQKKERIEPKKLG